MKQQAINRSIIYFVIISLFVCFSIGRVSAASSPFSDVKADSPYMSALVYLKEKGVVTGYDDGTFQPDKKVNRAEALKMLLTGLGIQIYPQKSSFPDVASSTWYAPFVSQALKNGYVKGYPDGFFRPEQNVNRVEALKMLLEISQVMKSMTITQKTYLEIDSGLWYSKYVLFALDKNLLDIYNENQIRAGEAVTRGDIADMLYRYMYMKEKNLTAFQNFEQGSVSYYADDLQGEPTSSGEPYDKDSFTAAHRTLAFGTYAQVVDKNHEKSAIVRINDRGPYTASHIIDISSKAFSTMAAMSSGRFDGEVYRVGKGSMNKKYISESAFSGIKLASPMPNMMLEGEFYTVSGTIANLASTAGGFVLSDNKGMEQEYDLNIQGSTFESTIYFPAEGVYTLTYGGAAQTIYVTNNLFSKPVRSINGLSGNLDISYTTTGLKLDWDASQNVNMYLLKFIQDRIVRTILVNNSTHVVIDPQSLNGLSEGSWTIEVYGAYTSTGYSHDRMTTWEKISTRTATFMTGFNPVFLSNNLQIDNKESEIVTTGETLQFKGKALVDLKNEFFTLTSDGVFKKEKLVDADDETVKAGTFFNKSYTIPKSGSYIFEIIRPDGKIVYLDMYRTQDVFTLSSDFVANNKTDPNDLTLARSKMLQWINEDRARSGLKMLEPAQTLDTIMTARADDLVARDYFSHYDPEGKSVNDLKYKYGFYPSVAENIAYSSEGILSAYLELRHSPSHLENILNADVEIAGFGFAQKDNIVYIAQGFSAKPLSAFPVNDLRTKWIAQVNTSGKNLQISDVLTTVTQDWAEDLAEAHVLSFKLNGKSLLEELLNKGGNGSYVANVVASDSLAGVEKKVVDILSKTMPGADIGIGIAQDSAGPIKVVIGIRE
ncbi:MAG: S-layer homology domain-containing protein [Candidatus Gracilibacteria bacterium]